MARDPANQLAVGWDILLSIAHHIRVLAVVLAPDNELRRELIALADDLVENVPGEVRF